MSNGVFALFGVTPATGQRAIESFASSFNMPYVSPSAPAPSWTGAGARHNASAAFTIYLRPTYHQAVIELVRAFRWTKIYYIYDDNDGINARLRYDTRCCFIKSALKSRQESA